MPLSSNVFDLQKANLMTGEVQLPTETLTHAYAYTLENRETATLMEEG